MKTENEKITIEQLDTPPLIHDRLKYQFFRLTFAGVSVNVSPEIIADMPFWKVAFTDNHHMHLPGCHDAIAFAIGHFKGGGK